MYIHEQAKEGKIAVFRAAGATQEEREFWGLAAMGVLAAAPAVSPVDCTELERELLPGLDETGETEWALNYADLNNVIPMQDLIWVEGRLRSTEWAILFTKLDPQIGGGYGQIIERNDLPAETQAVLDATILMRSKNTAFVAACSLVAINADGKMLQVSVKYPEFPDDAIGATVTRIGEIVLYVGLEALQRINAGQMFVFPPMDSATVQ